MNNSKCSVEQFLKENKTADRIFDPVGREITREDLKQYIGRNGHFSVDEIDHGTYDGHTYIREEILIYKVEDGQDKTNSRKVWC